MDANMVAFQSTLQQLANASNRVANKGKFNKTQQLELILVPGQPRAQFTPQTYLANKHMTSLEVYSINDMALSLSNNPLASLAVLQNCYITLYTNDVSLGLDPQGNGQGQSLWFRDMPIWNLHRLSNGVDPYVRDLFETMGQIVVWEQSYVQCQNIALVTSQVSIVFNVGYL